MNIFILSLTILAIYGIIVYAYKQWKRADTKEKMNEIEEVEEAYRLIKEFKKVHRANTNKQKQVIEDFNKE